MASELVTCQKWGVSWSRAKNVESAGNMNKCRVSWSRLEVWMPCQLFRHWVETDLHPVGTSSFHLQQGTPLTVNEVLQWRDLPGGTTSPFNSATPVPYKLSVPDLKHFYLEWLTTSIPHNPNSLLFMNSCRFMDICGHLWTSILSVTYRM